MRPPSRRALASVLRLSLVVAGAGCAPALAAGPPVNPAKAPVPSAVGAALPSAVTNAQRPDPSSPPAGPALSVTHRTITLDGAKVAIAGAIADARAKKTTGVVALVDAGGNLVAMERIDETFAAGAMISIGKARTAVLFKKPTRAFEEIIKNGRTAMVTAADVTSFTPLNSGPLT